MTIHRYPDSPDDFYFEVGLGNVPGRSAVLIRGHNPDLDADVEEDVWEAGGDLTYLTTAETMDVWSTQLADGTSGAGLITVMVFGVDNNHVAINELVTLAGSATATTALSFLRVNSMVGITAGSTGWNTGNIVAHATTANTVQCEMDATESISQNSHYTVPAGKTLVSIRAEFNATKNGAGQSAVVELKAYGRVGGSGSPWIQVFDKKMDTAVQDELDVIIAIPNALLTEKSDFRFRAVSSQDNTEVRTRLWGVLTDT